MMSGPRKNGRSPGRTVKAKVIVVLASTFFGVAAFFGAGDLVTTVRSFSSGPPGGYTGAPSEQACTACHHQNIGTGQFAITAPATYIPGQTYQLQVTHTTADQTRMRWGFELTALDGTNSAAGTFADTSLFTQWVGDNGRLYIEHTYAGTFGGQTGGAQWTFDWTAPAQNVGVVIFYAAGVQANDNGNLTGDQTYTTFAVCAPAGNPTPTPTPSPTPMVSISGHISYADPGGPVRNVVITVTSPSFPTQTVMTDANGDYVVTVPAGNDYTATPSKVTDINGLGSFDAAKLARFVAGLDVPTANQRIAADGDNDNIITSFDASLVARYVAGLPNYGIVGTWRFVPASRSYTALGGNQTMQTYTAILVGETSGNWMPAGQTTADDK